MTKKKPSYYMISESFIIFNTSGFESIKSYLHYDKVTKEDGYVLVSAKPNENLLRLIPLIKSSNVKEDIELMRHLYQNEDDNEYDMSFDEFKTLTCFFNSLHRLSGFFRKIFR